MLLPKVKLKALPTFPSAINGGTGIDVTKANGALTVDLDYSEFGTISTLPTSPHSYSLFYDTLLQDYTLVPASLLGGGSGGGGIADAPVDGFLYGRNSAAWQRVPDSVSFVQAGTGAVTRTMQNKARDIVSVKDFGAVGDSVADDTIAIQKALDAVKTTGGTVYFPPGNYKVSGGGLSINQSALTTDAALSRVSLLGAGNGNTQINYIGSGFALTFTGGSGGGAHGHFQIEKIRFQGQATPGTIGLDIVQAAFFAVRDCTITGFTTGVQLIDALSCSFMSCVISFNDNGVTGQMSANSPPNAVSFYSCQVAQNANAGISLSNPTTVNYFGGSIEGNGLGGTASNRFGVLIGSQTGFGSGPVAASFHGVYFEANANTADIWFIAGAASTNLMVSACCFNRIFASPNFTANNVRMDLSGGGGKTYLTLIGNGFQGFGSYVANAAQKYVAVNPGPDTKWNVFDQGNIYGNNIEKPAITGPIKASAAMASCWISCNGATSAVNESYNVGSFVRNSAGDYTLTFARPLATASYVVVGSLNAVGSVLNWIPSTLNVNFRTVNNAGTPTDFGNVSVAIFGGGDLT